MRWQKGRQSKVPTSLSFQSCWSRPLKSPGNSSSPNSCNNVSSRNFQKGDFSLLSSFVGSKNLPFRKWAEWRKKKKLFTNIFAIYFPPALFRSNSAVCILRNRMFAFCCCCAPFDAIWTIFLFAPHLACSFLFSERTRMCFGQKGVTWIQHELNGLPPTTTTAATTTTRTRTLNVFRLALLGGMEPAKRKISRHTLVETPNEGRPTRQVKEEKWTQEAKKVCFCVTTKKCSFLPFDARPM